MPQCLGRVGSGLGKDLGGQLVPFVDVTLASK